ncbi:MAG: substrate-binding domain-containing protein, partial [Wenzhouxiangellaceae bacterium]|nr:substrate-binding domain-containing protein [Wenzhouxiangellaceae bacterium]
SRVLREQGIEPRRVRDVDFTTRAGNQAMGRLLAAGGEAVPDAVFACNDLLAIGAIQSIREHGLRVPQDVSVVGYDDTALGAGMVPALSSVHQNLYQGGILLARKMLRLVEGGSERSEVLPTELVVRDS